MKLKEFIAKVKKDISGFIARLTKTAREVLPIGIEVVNLMKTVVESDTVDIITKLTPTNLDDNAVKALRIIIPKVLKKFEGWNDDIQAPENDILKAIVLTVNSYQEDKSDVSYLGIAARINVEMSNGAMTFSESLPSTHEAYNKPEILTA